MKRAKKKTVTFDLICEENIQYTQHYNPLLTASNSRGPDSRPTMSFGADRG